MKLNFGDLMIRRLIAHEVPQKGTKAGPELSDDDKAPDGQIESFFRQRMTGSLTDAGIDVVFDPAASQTVKDGITTLLSDPDQLVSVSQLMARHLYDVQNRQNTAGLLVVATGTIDARPAVCVLKLEHEEGIRVVELSAGGTRTFNLEYLNSLVLTKRTRVFKVGLFVEAKPVYARVSDEQFGRGANRGVAYFYLFDFLGCKFAAAPEVQTKDFLQAAQKFINEDVTDPEKQARYEQALLSELNSNEEGVKPRQFAQKHIDTSAERNRFVQRVQEAGLPTELVPKSLGLIVNTIKRIQMRFENGTTINAHPDLIGNDLKISRLNDGRTRVEMEDILRRIKPLG